MASQVESLKFVPGTSFIVDGFRFTSAKSRRFFLTHCHSDHYTGLTAQFRSGTIYCSPVSAAILLKDLFRGLPADRVCALPLDVPTVVDDLGMPVRVTPIDANHCPGAVMLLFEVPGKAGTTRRILHTGDFRWIPEMAQHPALAGKPLDVLMIDTTYADPSYVFPPQATCIQRVTSLVRDALAQEPRTLVVVGSYHIGKERVYMGVAEALGLRVFCKPSKRRLLHLLGLPATQLATLVDRPEAAHIHVVPMGDVRSDRIAALAKQLDRPAAIGIRPTGWSYRASGLQRSVGAGGKVSVYGVPYSEHSSWHDLCACVKALRPGKLIPTVNARDERQAQRIIDLFTPFLSGKEADPRKLDFFFTRAPRPSAQPGPAQDTPAALANEGPVKTSVGDKERPSAGACGAGDGPHDAPAADRVAMGSSAGGPGMSPGAAEGSGGCGAGVREQDVGCWEDDGWGDGVGSGTWGDDWQWLREEDLIEEEGRASSSASDEGPSEAREGGDHAEGDSRWSGGAGSAQVERGGAEGVEVVEKEESPPPLAPTASAQGARLGGSAAREPKEVPERAFELSGVDVREQEHILASIERSQRQKRAWGALLGSGHQGSRPTRKRS